MTASVCYPVPGCIVEYLEGNAAQIALVLEESGGRLRLLLPNRREVRVPQARILPWIGPRIGTPGREEATRLLEEHRARREEAANASPVTEAWELAQGEMESAGAQWFAELFHENPGPDEIAGFGRALLACKSHFRFQPPLFQIFDAETVARREAEQKQRQEREALVEGGASFLRLLWDVACGKCRLPAADAAGWPEPEVAQRIRRMLLARVADPESQEEAELWRLIARGLPEEPHLPLQLLIAWGVLAPHHNFWLDRAGYAPGDEWWRECRQEVEAVTAAQAAVALPPSGRLFISIDSPSTRDVDDAFSIEELADGWRVVLALACPALGWPFDGPLDELVRQRATSIYLPEGDCHMLPECLGTAACSLAAGQPRAALCLEIEVGRDGRARSFSPALALVELAANLHYGDCEAVLAAQDGSLPPNPAAPHAQSLRLARDLARARLAARLEAGAIVLERPEQEIVLSHSGEDVQVEIRPEEEAPEARLLVSELMILASACLADWALERRMPVLHRSQDVTLSREYSGIWRRPEDMARVMRALIPSSLEVEARPHAALGLARYAPVTSPLRRYPDLLNEAQLSHYLETGSPRWDGAALEKMLGEIRPALEGAGRAQRFRPRYWKLLFFRQQGEQKWWNGVITEENESFVTVSLPEQGLIVRGRRRIFDERACPGMPVALRLGRVRPLQNEIQILEASSLE